MINKYSNIIRSVSQGAASYTIEFSRFDLVPEFEQKRVLKEYGVVLPE